MVKQGSKIVRYLKFFSFPDSPHFLAGNQLYDWSTHMTVHSGAASGLRKLLAKVEISAGLLELVPALLPEFKTVFRLNFKQV